jgi:WD40 repeat protein
MADVYLGHQPVMDREVAIKVLPAHFLQDRTFLERFRREVQVIARLQHPHILPVYDHGEFEGMPYIVMAYLSGGSLAGRIEREPDGLPLAEVVRLVGQIASGLDFAHRKGIIHRDLKPGNVLFDEQGNAYLSDFGIARVIESTSQLTGSGIIGTPAYMAPEMSESGVVAPLIDVYALGVSVFQMLTGRLPYEADTPMGTALAHVTRPIPDARTYRSDLPAEVQAVIEQAMAKDPASRYQSAGALSVGLKEAAAALPGPGDGGTLPIPRPLPESTRQAAGQPAAAPARRHAPRWLAAAGGLALVAIITGLAAGGIWLADQIGGSLAPGAEDGSGQAAPTQTETALPTASAPGSMGSGEEPAIPPTETAPPTLAAAPVIRGTLIDFLSSVLSLTYSPDGGVLAIAGNGGLILYDVVSATWALSAEDQILCCAAFSPDGNSLALADEFNAVLVFDMASRALRLTLREHEDTVVGMAFTPAGELIHGSREGVLNWSDPVTGEALRMLFVPDLLSLALSPDGTLLAKGFWDYGLALDDLVEGSARAFGHDTGQDVSRIVFSPDGSRLAYVVRAGKLIVLDVASGDEIAAWDVPGGVNSLAYSPDGRYLAAGAYQTYLYDAASLALLHTLEFDTTTAVTALAFSPDGHTLATGNAGGSIVFWALDGGAGDLPGPTILPEPSSTPAPVIPTATPRPPTATPAPTATAAPTSIPRPRVYTCQPADAVLPGTEICLNYGDGSGQINLTRSAGADTEPSLSPDGTRVVFMSDRDFFGEVYMINIDGSNLTRLTFNSHDEGGPVWSPDGSRIAYMAQPGDNMEIFVMNADGSGQVNLTNNPANDFWPTWSADGTLIYFDTYRPDFARYVMNADGSDQRPAG